MQTNFSFEFERGMSLKPKKNQLEEKQYLGLFFISIHQRHQRRLLYPIIYKNPSLQEYHANF